MGIYEGTTLTAFGTEVVSLPDDISFGLGTRIVMWRSGDTVTIRRKVTPEEALASNRALADDLRAVWTGAPVHEIERREPIEAPHRPGLI